MHLKTVLVWTPLNLQEHHCFIASDYDGALQREYKFSYKLPDGLDLEFGSEAFRSPEIMFKPELIGIERDGVHQLVHESVSHCDGDLHAAMYSNIVCGGGNTLIKGFDDRLWRELDALLPYKVLVGGYVRESAPKRMSEDVVGLMNDYLSMIQIHAFEDEVEENEDASKREYSAWLGGSILSSLTTYQDVIIRMEEYDSSGPSIIHRKCPM